MMKQGEKIPDDAGQKKLNREEERAKISHDSAVSRYEISAKIGLQ